MGAENGMVLPVGVIATIVRAQDSLPRAVATEHQDVGFGPLHIRQTLCGNPSVASLQGGGGRWRDRRQVGEDPGELALVRPPVGIVGSVQRGLQDVFARTAGMRERAAEIQTNDVVPLPPSELPPAGEGRIQAVHVTDRELGMLPQSKGRGRGERQEAVHRSVRKVRRSTLRAGEVANGDTAVGKGEREVAPGRQTSRNVGAPVVAIVEAPREGWLRDIVRNREKTAEGGQGGRQADQRTRVEKIIVGQRPRAPPRRWCPADVARPRCRRWPRAGAVARREGAGERETSLPA